MYVIFLHAYTHDRPWFTLLHLQSSPKLPWVGTTMKKLVLVIIACSSTSWHKGVKSISMWCCCELVIIPFLYSSREQCPSVIKFCPSFCTGFHAGNDIDIYTYSINCWSWLCCHHYMFITTIYRNYMGNKFSHVSHGLTLSLNLSKIYANKSQCLL